MLFICFHFSTWMFIVRHSFFPSLNLSFSSPSTFCARSRPGRCYRLEGGQKVFAILCGDVWYTFINIDSFLIAWLHDWFLELLRVLRCLHFFFPSPLALVFFFDWIYLSLISLVSRTYPDEKKASKKASEQQHENKYKLNSPVIGFHFRAPFIKRLLRHTKASAASYRGSRGEKH